MADQILSADEARERKRDTGRQVGIQKYINRSDLGNQQMYRIYYFSTATDDVTKQDHENILEAARRNNEALGITGLLVVKGRFFIQVLEGDEQAVMSLYRKIKQDKRHRRVVEIWKGSVDDRIFGAWRMGFRDIGLSDEFSEVDLDDPTFVSNPAELERVFRRLIEMSPTAT